jgi:hypothetical protein
MIQRYVSPSGKVRVWWCLGFMVYRSDRVGMVKFRRRWTYRWR